MVPIVKQGLILFISKVRGLGIAGNNTQYSDEGYTEKYLKVVRGDIERLCKQGNGRAE